jgi:predicted SAM-dependent methyltransferase
MHPPKKNMTTEITPSNVALNLGCGKNILPAEQGWINVDCIKKDGVDVVCDLDDCRENPLPFENDTVSVVLLSHIIEHLHNVLPLMEEIHRVCKNGAQIVIRTPHGASDDAWTDPTHLRAYFPDSFGFFSQPYYWRADYGYKGDFKSEAVRLYIEKKELQHDTDQEIVRKVMHERNWVEEIEVIMSCVKPPREQKRHLQDPIKLHVLKRGRHLNPDNIHNPGGPATSDATSTATTSDATSTATTSDATSTSPTSDATSETKETVETVEIVD